MASGEGPTRRQVLGGGAVLAASAVLTGGATRADAEHGDVSWLAEVQTPPAALPKKAPTLASLLVDDAGGKIDTPAKWQEKRKQLLAQWLQFLGPLKVKQDPPKLKVLEEEKLDGAIRQRISYEVEPGITVEAYLLMPAKLEGKAPGVVVMHETTNATIRVPAGVGGGGETAFALRLAKQGCVAICPICFLWVGEGNFNQRVAGVEKRHTGSKGMAKMLFDAQRAVDALAALPQVDPNRLGAVGHSLGAKEALYLAAFDERIIATVSSEGGVGVRFSNWDAPWYLTPAINDPAFKRDHHELLALIAPRPFLLVGGDSADGDQSWPFIDAALPVYRLLAPRSRPRLGLLNHRKGHTVPPDAQKKIDEWLLTYLG